MKEPKKFNIAEAISGKPVQTRDGQLVTQLHEFKDVSFKNSLFGVMNSAVHAWKLNGSYILEDRLHNLDLFMAPIKTKYYVHVFKVNGASGAMSTTAPMLKTWDEHFASILQYVDSLELVKTFEFEIEE